MGLLMIGDNDVTVGKDLRVMLHFEKFLSDNLYDFAFRIHFDNTVEISGTDQRIAVGHPCDRVGVGPTLIVTIT